MDNTKENVDLRPGVTSAPPTPKAPANPGLGLIKERRFAHGNWEQQARCAQELKSIIRRYVEVCNPNMSPAKLEALEMDAVKTSRIACGNPDHADHWDDKSGYAMLGKGAPQS